MRERERGEERRVIRALGNDFGLHRPRGIDDRHSEVMNYSRRNVELIAYNVAIRDAILRIQRYIRNNIYIA